MVAQGANPGKTPKKPSLAPKGRTESPQPTIIHRQPHRLSRNPSGPPPLHNLNHHPTDSAKPPAERALRKVPPGPFGKCHRALRKVPPTFRRSQFPTRRTLITEVAVHLLRDRAVLAKSHDHLFLAELTCKEKLDFRWQFGQRSATTAKLGALWVCLAGFQNRTPPYVATVTSSGTMSDTTSL